jgi:hypothetical protein
VPTVVRPGAELETLTASISLAVHARGKSLGGRGYLVFKQPDRLRMVITSPFGMTLAELFSVDDSLTLLIPSKNSGYRGRFAELPEEGGIQNWGMMRWVMEPVPAAGGSDGRMEYVSPDGRRETVYFNPEGLVTRKVNAAGDEVRYEEYQTVNGVALPARLVMTSRIGDTVRVELEEPEVNQPVEDALLVPRLDGVTVLPFSAFKGF